mmetsp:Transcript_24450/g.73594  ORF Transcript_24450/g.73594 Transcript_24450/m.73594 type:complete len:206 (-) Transcript_24450:42-659(-)
MHVARQRLPHVERVLRAAVVAQDPPIHGVAEVLVHADGQRVRHAHEEVHEVRVKHVLRRRLERVHELAPQPAPPELGRDRHRRHVAVPELALALGLAHDVAHELAVRVRLGLEELGPRAHVLKVERDLVRLRQRVQVDVVELEQVLAAERARGRHGRGASASKRRAWTVKPVLVLRAEAGRVHASDNQLSGAKALGGARSNAAAW